MIRGHAGPVAGHVEDRHQPAAEVAKVAQRVIPQINGNQLAVGRDGNQIVAVHDRARQWSGQLEGRQVRQVTAAAALAAVSTRKQPVSNRETRERRMIVSSLRGRNNRACWPHCYPERERVPRSTNRSQRPRFSSESAVWRRVARGPQVHPRSSLADRPALLVEDHAPAGAQACVGHDAGHRVLVAVLRRAVRLLLALADALQPVAHVERSM